MSTLRGRLTVGLLLGITLTLAITGAAVSAVVERRLRDELDRSLVALLRTSVADVAREAGRPGGGEEVPDFGGPVGRVARMQFERWRLAFMAPTDGADVLLQCWLTVGRGPTEVFVRSEALGDASLPRLVADRRPRGLAEALGTEPLLANVTLPGGGRGRAAGLSVLAPSVAGELRARLAARLGPPRGALRSAPRGAPAGLRPDGADFGGSPTEAVLELVVALDTAPLATTVRQLRLLLALGWLVSSLGCVGLAWWTVRRGLAPLERLRAQIGSRAGDAPGPAFTLPDAPGELVPVVDQLNALMTRIAGTLAREQALQSAAAHELRTPLAGLRSTLEVALSRERSTEAWAQTAEQCLAITLEMQALVEALLELARAAAPGSARSGQRVRPVELIEAAWRVRAPDAQARGLSLACGLPDELELRSDAGLLQRVFDNLIDNAISYADADTPVQVRAERDGTRWRLVVDNARADAHPSQAERALEPFWRGDPGRGGTGRHAGLGLALCRRIVETLGGELGVEAGAGRFAVTVSLPADG